MSTRAKKDTQIQRALVKKRKTLKICDEADLSPQEREWKITYAIFLKASEYSDAYISDTIRVQRKIVKEWFADPAVQANLIEVQADIVGNTIRRVKDIMGWAWEALHEFARSEPDHKLRLQAILEILDRGGLTKVNKSERAEPVGPSVYIDTHTIEEIEKLPLETQKKLARMGEEMQEMMVSAKGKE
jgi:hypothetical protein